MDPWKVLEIEPTGETSIIKKAYAKKLKIYHPEDDPEGFQRLRESYDRALKLAKSYKQKETQNNSQVVESSEKEASIQQQTINNEDRQQMIINDEGISQQEIKVSDGFELFEQFFDYLEEDNIIPKVKLPLHNILANDIEEENIIPKVKLPQHNILENYTHEFNKLHREQQLVYRFMYKVERLYHDFFARIQEENWIRLLDDAIMSNLYYKESINKEMLEFLVCSHNIPQNIWVLLINSFHWDEQQKEIYSRYSKEYAKLMFRNLSNEMLPRYCYFSSRDKFSHDKYLEARQKAFDALEQNKLTVAWKYIYIAKEIYLGDPDLWCMEAEYHLKAKDIKKARIAFEKAEQINPKDMDTIFYKAQVMYNSRRFSESISICKQIKNINPSDFKVLCLMSKSYVKLKRWKKAREVLEYNLSIKRDDIETKRSFIELARELEASLKRYPLSLEVRKELRAVYKFIGESKNSKIFQTTSGTITEGIILNKRWAYFIMVIVIIVVVPLINGPTLNHAVKYVKALVGIIILTQYVLNAIRKRKK
ncbi:J domain-containing protein [Inconstantimicrobium mannanitabidum]|uniref:Uncharacterized protein n=1 Tax=Inconstantimicrobium mannanitabidum TaxID=1604901 RepID=A0ACB5RHI8_9CLOT|nr:CDC27 family protein [Clostridium sp. TW13]GKX68555.1 hypothetical protein rsdtw13_38130 [Clostridium sp. TW13]